MNENIDVIPSPTNFTTTFEVYASLLNCEYWMPNFQIQFEYLEGSTYQYASTWKWGTTVFDLCTGCDNYDNQRHSQTDFPGFYWLTGLPQECMKNITSEPTSTSRRGYTTSHTIESSGKEWLTSFQFPSQENLNLPSTTSATSTKSRVPHNPRISIPPMPSWWTISTPTFSTLPSSTGTIPETQVSTQSEYSDKSSTDILTLSSLPGTRKTISFSLDTTHTSSLYTNPATLTMFLPSVSTSEIPRDTPGSSGERTTHRFSNHTTRTYITQLTQESHSMNTRLQSRTYSTTKHTNSVTNYNMETPSGSEFNPTTTGNYLQHFYQNITSSTLNSNTRGTKSGASESVPTSVSSKTTPQYKGSYFKNSTFATSSMTPLSTASHQSVSQQTATIISTMHTSTEFWPYFGTSLSHGSHTGDVISNFMDKGLRRIKQPQWVYLIVGIF